MASLNFVPRLGRRATGALFTPAVLAVLCAGCASRFTTETQYLAPGFTRGALRGKTVAVLPLTPEAAAVAAPAHVPVPASAPASAPASVHPDAPPSGDGGEFAGVAGGLREAGARVRLLAPGDWPSVATQPGAVGAAYLLVVRLTDAGVYRAHRPRRGRGASRVVSRTSGRRVGLRLALLRLPDARPVWLAGGTGEVWETRAGSAGAHRGASRGAAAADLADHRAADDPWRYPPPPAPDVVSRRLTRRLIAGLPYATELEPN